MGFVEEGQSGGQQRALQTPTAPLVERDSVNNFSPEAPAIQHAGVLKIDEADSITEGGAEEPVFSALCVKISVLR